MSPISGGTPGGPPPKAPMAPKDLGPPLAAPSRAMHGLGADKKELARESEEDRSAAERSKAPADEHDFGASEDSPSGISLGRASSTTATPPSSPYLAALGQLARELDAQARGRADLTAIRLLRQRIVEWTEDLRSVGDSPEVAAAVEQLVQRLSAALATATQIVAEAIAVAAELSKLAAGHPPPPRPSGRAAFWK